MDWLKEDLQKIKVFLKTCCDLFFPPLCFYCKQKTDMPYLCFACWEESVLLDPEHRCSHCFESLEDRSILCPQCLKNPHLLFPKYALFDSRSPICTILKNEELVEAIAGFAFYQWERLHLPSMDYVVSMPHQKSLIGASFAKLLDLPYIPLFQKHFFSSNPFDIDVEIVEEWKGFILFDEGGSFEDLKLATQLISLAFPKRVYILSLKL